VLLKISARYTPSASRITIAGKHVSIAAANVIYYAVVKDSPFRDGTIEVDLAGQQSTGAGTGARGFIGIAFRVQQNGSEVRRRIAERCGRRGSELRGSLSIPLSAILLFPGWPRGFPLRRASRGEGGPAEHWINTA
jgi:hypothetical protein